MAMTSGRTPTVGASQREPFLFRSRPKRPEPSWPTRQSIPAPRPFARPLCPPDARPISSVVVSFPRSHPHCRSPRQLAGTRRLPGGLHGRAVVVGEAGSLLGESRPAARRGACRGGGGGPTHGLPHHRPNPRGLLLFGGAPG